ncbi:DUF4265 domain-containing protein [Burkholderia plantarii]|uniref:DUF4265 domain-containing protein n=1 Tax=Burkholderia plantarii TaxID=41899 RepID=UPI00209ACA33|nr:DUF4265 domain-containing protein [Burkholderia plantarii]
MLNEEAAERHMDVEKEHCLINVYAGRNESGPVYEELPARKMEGGVYELLASPGLTLNLAKGDWVRLDGNDHPATVVRRGGNFCIQIYADEMPKEDIEWLERVLIEEVSGTLDGVNGGNLSCSVPAANGLDKINVFFEKFKRRTGIEWYYSNVYKNFEDPSDETLLNWWIDGVGS